MKSQILHTVWCHISDEATGEIWHWSLRDSGDYRSSVRRRGLIRISSCAFLTTCLRVSNEFPPTFSRLSFTVSHDCPPSFSRLSSEFLTNLVVWVLKSLPLVSVRRHGRVNLEEIECKLCSSSAQLSYVVKISVSRSRYWVSWLTFNEREDKLWKVNWNYRWFEIKVTARKKILFPGWLPTTFPVGWAEA